MPWYCITFDFAYYTDLINFCNVNLKIFMNFKYL